METQEPGVRIIDKSGPLNNFADRDHCSQYMAAIGLLFGELTANHYTDDVASDPRIDALRELMVVRENEAFTRDYYDLDKRAIGNSMQVFFSDGTSTDRVEIQYPIGHRNRRDEGIPVLQEKFKNSLTEVFEPEQCESILETFENANSLDQLSASQFLDRLVKAKADISQMLA